MSFNLPKTETTLQEQLHTPRQHDQTYLQYFDILTYRRRQEDTNILTYYHDRRLLIYCDDKTGTIYHAVTKIKQHFNLQRRPLMSDFTYRRRQKQKYLTVPRRHDQTLSNLPRRVTRQGAL